MTRRTWFAAIAALFARKVPPAATTAPISPLMREIVDYCEKVIAPQVTARIFSPVQYRMGIQISREMIENDRVHLAIHRPAVAARERQKQLDAEMCAQIFRDPPDICA